MINLRILLAISFHLSGVWGLAVKQLSLLMSCLKKKKDCSTWPVKVVSFGQEETFSTRVLSSPDFIVFTKQLGHQSLKKKKQVLEKKTCDTFVKTYFSICFFKPIGSAVCKWTDQAKWSSQVNSLLSAFVHLKQQWENTNLIHVRLPAFRHWGVWVFGCSHQCHTMVHKQPVHSACLLWQPVYKE